MLAFIWHDLVFGWNMLWPIDPRVDSLTSCVYILYFQTIHAGVVEGCGSWQHLCPRVVYKLVLLSRPIDVSTLDECGREVGPGDSLYFQTGTGRWKDGKEWRNLSFAKPLQKRHCCLWCLLLGGFLTKPLSKITYETPTTSDGWIPHEDMTWDVLSEWLSWRNIWQIELNLNSMDT